MVGNAIRYDTFAIRNMKWLWFVNDTVEVINNNNILHVCGCFELYLTFVAGILDSVKGINFYVACNKKLNYADYIKQCISEKMHYFIIALHCVLIISMHLSR
jgi:hypothetical protein